MHISDPLKTYSLPYMAHPAYFSAIRTGENSGRRHRRHEGLAKHRDCAAKCGEAKNGSPYQPYEVG